MTTPLELNAISVIKWMRRHNMETIKVSYEGCGDSGGIDEIEIPNERKIDKILWTDSKCGRVLTENIESLSKSQMSEVKLITTNN